MRELASKSIADQGRKPQEYFVYTLATPKNEKSRCIKAAATVMRVLKQEWVKQASADRMERFIRNVSGA